MVSGRFCLRILKPSSLPGCGLSTKVPMAAHLPTNGALGRARTRQLKDAVLTPLNFYIHLTCLLLLASLLFFALAATDYLR